MLGQLRTLNNCPGTSVPDFKPWSDEGVVTVAGAGWHWKLLATILHPGGQNQVVVLL